MEFVVFQSITIRGSYFAGESESQWKPIVRSLTETERRYVQIEKESLAITWACNKFASFIAIGNANGSQATHTTAINLPASKEWLQQYHKAQQEEKLLLC